MFNFYILAIPLRVCRARHGGGGCVVEIEQQSTRDPSETERETLDILELHHKKSLTFILALLWIYSVSSRKLETCGYYRAFCI